MTADERVRTLMDFRFTERQARFLALVMRHAGVCVRRQYAGFACIAHGGAKCNALFARLVRRGYAGKTACVHNRARLYRVNSKRIYYAIGEPNSRYRRPVPARAAVERLMLLDAVLANPDLNWLATESEKAAFAATVNTSEPVDESPDAPVDRTVSGSRSTFPATYPIGLEPSGRVVLLYLATVPWTEDFRRFLQAHAALLQRVRAWTLRLVFPRPVDHAYEAYHTVIREELETPLHPATIRELKWYFEHRRAAVDQRPGTLTQGFLDKGKQVFEGPRFRLLYRRWLTHGDAAFETVSSPSIAEALATETARVECFVLPHTYRHLSPLVDHVRSTPERVEKGFRWGNREGNSPPHALNPGPQPRPVEPELSIKEQLERDWHRLNDCYNEQKKLGLRP
jgi:hypothetical protein